MITKNKVAIVRKNSKKGEVLTTSEFVEECCKSIPDNIYDYQKKQNMMLKLIITSLTKKDIIKLDDLNDISNEPVSQVRWATENKSFLNLSA